MIAISLIRSQPCYRSEAFAAGLTRAGYKRVSDGRPSGPQDLLVIWNRYAQFDARATAWERAGGTVLVAENGYLGKDGEGRQYYALAAKGHNGSGWSPGPLGRFAALGIRPRKWQAGGEQIVIRGQRGIGTPLMASPTGWHERTAGVLRGRQPLPVMVRPHPQTRGLPPQPPIEPDLERATGCVIWCSSVGVKALVMGIPVWYDAPHWICHKGGRRLRDDPTLANPLTDDAARMAALEEMAGAQWSVAELEGGEPFALFSEALKVAA